MLGGGVDAATLVAIIGAGLFTAASSLTLRAVPVIVIPVLMYNSPVRRPRA